MDSNRTAGKYSWLPRGLPRVCPKNMWFSSLEAAASCHPNREYLSSCKHAARNSQFGCRPARSITKLLFSLKGSCKVSDVE